MEGDGQGRDTAAYPRERDWAPILREVEWDPGPMWTGAANLALTTKTSPDRQSVANRYTD